MTQQEIIHNLSNQINYLEIEQNHYIIDNSEIIKKLYNEVYEIIETK